MEPSVDPGLIFLWIFDPPQHFQNSFLYALPFPSPWRVFSSPHTLASSGSFLLRSRVNCRFRQSLGFLPSHHHPITACIVTYHHHYIPAHDSPSPSPSHPHDAAPRSNTISQCRRSTGKPRTPRTMRPTTGSELPPTTTSPPTRIWAVIPVRSSAHPQIAIDCSFLIIGIRIL